MPVNAWYQAHTNPPSDSFCNSPLIHSPQAGVSGVLDSSHRSRELGHHVVILVSGKVNAVD